MKNHLIFYLLSNILMSCSHEKPISNPSSNVSPPLLRDFTQKSAEETRVLFHLIFPESVDLVINRVGLPDNQIIHIDKILSQTVISPGHWKITGVNLNGVHFKLANETNAFHFHVKKKQVSYVGSYIVQCPLIDQTGLKEMKKMKFFNRYRLSSKSKLCELVIGSDFKRVKKVSNQLEGAKFPLSLGF